MKKIIIFFVFVLLDFTSKYIVKNNFVLNERIEISKFLDFIYIKNYGVSFGLFSGFISYWVLILIGFLIVILVFYLMIVSQKKFEKTAYFLIISGAIGNILDRTINTYVVDFILFHYKNYYWPAFNFADIYITIGIIMLVVTFFIKSEESR